MGHEPQHRRISGGSSTASSWGRCQQYHHSKAQGAQSLPKGSPAAKLGESGFSDPKFRISSSTPVQSWGNDKVLGGLHRASARLVQQRSTEFQEGPVQGLLYVVPCSYRPNTGKPLGSKPLALRAAESSRPYRSTKVPCHAKHPSKTKKIVQYI